MAFYIPVCAGGVLAGISPLCFLSVFNYSSERILQCISGHFLFIVWALGILNTALSEVKLHLAPASLYEYSHFISVPLGWLADFAVLARLWLEERIGRKWTRDGEKSAVCFAGPSRADEAFQFLFPIIFNRLNLHVAMATTQTTALFWDIRIRGGIQASLNGRRRDECEDLCEATPQDTLYKFYIGFFLAAVLSEQRHERCSSFGCLKIVPTSHVPRFFNI